jgi:hypothetical protein
VLRAESASELLTLIRDDYRDRTVSRRIAGPTARRSRAAGSFPRASSRPAGVVISLQWTSRITVAIIPLIAWHYPGGLTRLICQAAAVPDAVRDLGQSHKRTRGYGDDQDQCRQKHVQP